jgi:hypothetical protein
MTLMDATITDMNSSGGSGLRDAPTLHFDSVQCLTSREIHKAVAGDGVAHGSYMLVPGTEQALLIPLDESRAHVGRGLHADLTLDDASVSRRHAIILRTDGGHEILDDRSLNGTYLNGQKINRAELHDGDMIKLGRVELTYREM